MESKKNPKADLSKRSMLFFQLGMVFMLFLAWQAIEWKTYDRSLAIDRLNVGDELEEEIPITQTLTPPPPPPPPPPAPEVIEVVEDEEEVEETIIESTETNQEEEIMEIAEIEEVVEEEIADVPFAVIENVPIYPGCEKEVGNAGKKKCMSEKIQKFIQIKIDKKGNVVNVRARAPHPKLEQEAVSVVKALPKMTPGKQRGKSVGVLYALPILFQVEN